MMELTRKSDYAIRGIVYLAQRQGEVCLIGEVAAAVHVPQTFLAKIFQQFSKNGLARSYRGSGGGFVLGRTPGQITLLEVVEAVEGPIVVNRCTVQGNTCDQAATCKTHRVWRDVQLQLRELLGAITLEQLA